MSLDNPRTEREITYVEKYIREAYKNESAFQFTEEDLQKELKRGLKSLAKDDEYIKEFSAKHGELDAYSILARMWIVARYDDDGQIEALENASPQFQLEKEAGFFLLNDRHPILKNSRQLTEYSHLLSLLIHTDNEFYEGMSFLLEYDSDWYQELKVNHFPCISVMKFIMYVHRRHLSTEGEERWHYLPLVKHDLLRAVELLDSGLNAGLTEQILYIASLLRVSGYDIKDDKTKLVTLVSIIELLVTHNPDSQRFNVEDSINKQFQLKAAALIYINDKSRNISQIKLRLKEIYGLRSAIAHGDFKAITKYVENAEKKGQEYPFGDLISDLYTFLKAIITEYLRDSTFVNFLKDG